MDPELHALQALAVAGPLLPVGLARFLQHPASRLLVVRVQGQYSCIPSHGVTGTIRLFTTVLRTGARSSPRRLSCLFHHSNCTLVIVYLLHTE